MYVHSYSSTTQYSTGNKEIRRMYSTVKGPIRYHLTRQYGKGGTKEKGKTKKEEKGD